MRAVLLLFFISAVLQSGHAQNVSFEWVKQLGGPLNGYATGIRVHDGAYIYTTGYFEGSTDFDPGPGVYSLGASAVSDIFITKMDNNGNLVWAKRIGGSGLDIAYAITTDAAGNIFITGNFEGTADFDPGTQVYNLTSLGLRDIFILKLDALGNFNWARQMKGNAGGPTDNTEGNGYAIATDALGNVFTAGIFNGGSIDFDPGPAVYNLSTATNSGLGDDDIFVTKLDVNGNFIAAIKIGSPAADEICNSIALDLSGNLYLSGSFHNTVDFDPGPATFELTAVRADNFICKLDANCLLSWVKQFKGNNEFASTCAISLDNTGNIVTTGLFYSTVDFDPGPGSYFLDCNAGHIFITKLDAAGNFMWAKQVGNDPSISDFVSSITTDTAGNIYTTGTFQQTVDFDPGPAVFSLNAATYQDIYILKLDDSGNFAWAKKIGSAGSFEIPNGVAVDPALNVYTAGYFTGTAEFDPGIGSYNVASAGVSDVFIHKMKNCANSTVATITATACDSYTLNGQTYTTSGIFNQALTNVSGCDSTLIINLTLNSSNVIFQAVSCTSYSWQGQTFTSTGTYQVNFINAAGCDSILTLDLQIYPALSTIRTVNICQGEIFEGHALNGIYIDTLRSIQGCDSLAVLDLKVKAAAFSVIDTAICMGSVYQGYSKAGIYTDTLLSSNGCDSIRRLKLKVKNDCMGIPNAFTPDNDGINDQFRPLIGQSISGYTLLIYNRYGQKIFESGDYLRGWDGRSRGKEQPAGTYVYQLRYTPIGRKPVLIHDTILLIR